MARKIKDLEEQLKIEKDKNMKLTIEIENLKKFYENNGSKIRLLKENSGLMMIEVEIKESNNSITLGKAQAVFVSAGKQTSPLPIRYIYYNNLLIKYKYYIFK